MSTTDIQCPAPVAAGPAASPPGGPELAACALVDRAEARDGARAAAVDPAATAPQPGAPGAVDSPAGDGAGDGARPVLERPGLGPVEVRVARCTAAAFAAALLLLGWYAARSALAGDSWAATALVAAAAAAVCAVGWVRANAWHAAVVHAVGAPRSRAGYRAGRLGRWQRWAGQVLLSWAGQRRADDLAEVSDLVVQVRVLEERLRVAEARAAQSERSTKAASAGLTELVVALVEAEESTRGQLAADLHDTVAQALSLARGLSAQVPQDARLNPGDRAKTILLNRRIADLVGEAEEQLRAVMARTRPPELESGDLTAAVDTVLEDLALRYGLQVITSWPTVPQPLPVTGAVTAYRFIQESLMNVVKHSDQDVAWLDIEAVAGGVQVRVRDAGPGFDPDAVTSHAGRHVGLRLMADRARLVGGSVSVDSAPGAGTTCTLLLPTATADDAGPVHRPAPARLW